MAEEKLLEKKKGSRKSIGVKAEDEKIEKLMDDLKKVSEDISSEDISLEEAFLKYQEGMKLVERCKNILNHFQLQVEEIKN